MRKRTHKMISVIMMLVCLLSGCGKTPASEPEAASAEPRSTPDYVTPEAEEPDEPAEKIALTMAVVDNPLNIHTSFVVQDFNNQSDKYKIVIKDYSDRGEYDYETAKMKLNVDIGSGNVPDLICFWGMSPYTFISHNYLMDMLPYLDEDEDLSRDDISILNALTAEGGLYFLSDYFALTTGVGKYSIFGDRYGWTLDEYLELEKNRQGGYETIYNMTRESFIEYIMSRFVSDSIDWQNGVCDLNNDTFISLLKAGAQINETPEPLDSSLMDFTYSSTRVAQGTLIMALAYCTNAARLAYDEYMAGEKLSFIGWPTAHGSCGSDVVMTCPVGICSYTESPEGCWEFMKYMLTNYSEGYGSLAVFKPTLLDAMEYLKKEAIKQSLGDGVLMTDEDADRFLELLKNTNRMEISDEAVMSIVTEEAMAYFDGKQTVERTAELIQSRVQLYVSEQCG